MGFLGIGTGEILIILIIALVIVGPHKLPELAKILGRGFTEFKKATDDLKDSVNAEIQIGKLKQTILDVPSPSKSKSPPSNDKLEKSENPVSEEGPEHSKTDKENDNYE